MRNKRLKLSAVLFLLGIGLAGLHAQESVNATGGDASGSGGTISYSVGQIVTQTHAGTSGSVAEGVQQPFEVSVVTGIEEANDINLSISAYPNPTTNFIQLEVASEKLKGLSYQLYDMNGKLLQSEKVTSNQTRIEMSDLVPGNYFVKVIQENREVKTFKVVKH